MLPIALTVFVSLAGPMPVPGCEMRHEARFVERLSDVRPDIRDDVLGRVGAMAEPDEPYSSSDAGPFLYPSRKFIRAGWSGNFWFVWYRHGGRGVHTHILIYRLESGRLEGNFVGDNPCQTTDAALDGTSVAAEF